MDTFTARLRAAGQGAYHDKHPFHVSMNEGRLSREAVRGWVANRCYYQLNLPRKDAAIIANCPLREVRRQWLHRLVDHDGTQGEEGGIEAWVRLGKACELSEQEMLDERHVAPGVRFAVDAYFNFARTQPWPVAVSSSLTELFAPDLMATRLAAFERYYTWVAPWGFDYFQRRLTQARRDAAEGLALTLRYCDTPEMQQGAVRAMGFKCDVLWTILDAIAAKYGY